MEVEKPRCGRPNKRGEPCRKYPIRGRTACRNHGGATLVGAAHPSFKTGRYSKHFPARIAERFEQALVDPTLLSLREDIAAQTLRIEDLFDTAYAAGIVAGDVPKRLRTLEKRYKAAERRNDAKAKEAALNDLWVLVGDVIDDRSAWSDIQSAMMIKKQLIEAENKALVDQQQMVTAQQLNVMMGAVSHVIMQATAHITDPDERRTVVQAISRDIAALMGHDGN